MGLKSMQTPGVFVCKTDERSFASNLRADGSLAGEAAIVSPDESPMRAVLWTRESEFPEGSFVAERDEVFVVLQGRMDLELVDTGEILVCEAGDTVFHAKGVRLRGFVRERPFVKFGVTVKE